MCIRDRTKAENMEKLQGQLQKFSRKQVLEAIVPSVGKVKNTDLKTKLRFALRTAAFRKAMAKAKGRKGKGSEQEAAAPEDPSEDLIPPPEQPVFEPINVRVAKQSVALKRFYALDGLQVSAADEEQKVRVVFETMGPAGQLVPEALLLPRRST